MSMIDSHCHLDMEPLSQDIEGAIKRAHEAGVDIIINIGTSLHRSKQSVEIAKKYPNVWASVGFHPQDAAEVLDMDLALADLEELAQREEVVAIGEVGLDYYSAGTGTKGSINAAEKEKQLAILEAQLELAQRMNLPVIFHVRDAWDDFFATIENWKLKNGNYPKGVVHCFTGDAKIARKLVGMGLFIGFTGLITFKNESTENIRDAVRGVPLERILVETDAPFLAPEPHRGKVNEPAYVVEMVKKVAEIKQIMVSEVAEMSSQNAKKVFNIS